MAATSIDDVVMPKFSTGQIYNSIRDHRPTVPWKHAVWNSRGIPKHSFLTWLFVLNRCPTRDLTPIAFFVTLPLRDHLYFDCNFSWTIWRRMSQRCQLSPIRRWNDNILTMQQLRGPKEKKTTTWIAWQCTIYFIWSERNNRLHQNLFKSADSIINSIDGIVCNRASSIRDSNPSLASAMLQFCFAFSSS